MDPLCVGLMCTPVAVVIIAVSFIIIIISVISTAIIALFLP